MKSREWGYILSAVRKMVYCNFNFETNCSPALTATQLGSGTNPRTIRQRNHTYTYYAFYASQDIRLPRFSPPRRCPSARPSVARSSASRRLRHRRRGGLGFQRELSYLLLRVKSPRCQEYSRSNIPFPADRHSRNRQLSLQSLLPLRRPQFHDRSAQSHYCRHEHH